MTDEFRAHAELRNIRPQKCFNGYKAEEYLAEFDSLVDQLAAYKRAVIVLEDGAEPEVGDLIYKHYAATSHLEEDSYNCWWVVYNPNADNQTGLSYAKKLVKEDSFNIIRQGKPCIYKSNLKKDG